MNIQQQAEITKKYLKAFGYAVTSMTAGTRTVYVSAETDKDVSNPLRLFTIRIADHDYNPNNGQTDYMIGVGQEAYWSDNGFETAAEFIRSIAKRLDLPVPPSIRAVFTRRENRIKNFLEKARVAQKALIASKAAYMKRYNEVVPLELRIRYAASDALTGQRRKRARYLLRREIKQYLPKDEK